MDTDSTSESPRIPNTEAIRRSLENIEDDFGETIDGWFGEIEERLTEVQDVLRSAALRKILGELGKLRIALVDKVPEAIEDVRFALEAHDRAVDAAIKSTAVEGEVSDAA